MENTLIIGANSFLSLQLSELLTDQNITAIFHNNKDKLVASNVKYVPVKDIATLKDEFKTVYFISAFIPQQVKSNDDENLFEVNILLLKKCLSLFSNARFIMASTVSVYGQGEGILSESSLGKNINNYGLSKLWAENILKQHHSYAIIRISSMYGVGMNKQTFLPRIIESALNNNEITIYGDGSRLQNYIHVSDVALMMKNASLTTINNIYLAANTLSHANKEVGELIKNNIPGVTMGYKGIDGSLSYNYDASFTYDHLGYPKKKLESEISDLIKWIKK